MNAPQVYADSKAKALENILRDLQVRLWPASPAARIGTITVTSICLDPGDERAEGKESFEVTWNYDSDRPGKGRYGMQVMALRAR